MQLFDEILEEKDHYLERFHFALERIHEIHQETTNSDCPVSTHGEAFADYFHKVSAFLLQIADFYQKNRKASLLMLP